MGTYLERYLAGGREPVWRELTALDEGVAAPGMWEDAFAVAWETMQRARANVETVTKRLRLLGYAFSHPEAAWLPAEPVDEARIADIESMAGPLPISLRAWYQVVGSVDWRGSHPDWEAHQAVTAGGLCIPPVHDPAVRRAVVERHTADAGLIDTLRAAFRFGGFPGFAGVPSPEAVTWLAEGLQEL